MSLTIPRATPAAWPLETARLGRWQLAWLAAAVFVVSAGYGALLPLIPGWLAPLMPGASAAEVARHVGFLSGVYAAGVLVGAPLWGRVADRVGRGRILIFGMVGYVASLLLLLVPGFTGLWAIYALRGTTGLFVAAVVPVVTALVAEHTPATQRARRFAWLGSMSLLGFLFGPALTASAEWFASAAGLTLSSPAQSVQVVVVLSALFGSVMMAGLAVTLPPPRGAAAQARTSPENSVQRRLPALLVLSAVMLFVLAGFEIGIVLQGQQAGQSSRQAAIMFAECSLVMLGVNALLFFTALLEKVSSRTLVGAGLVLAAIGLGVMALHRTDPWMYLGVSLTSAGTGLVLPVIAYLGAGASPQRLGATMGGLAAAAGFGQTAGSAGGGWLFGAAGQVSFAWLILPLLVMLGLLLVRPGLWSYLTAGSTHGKRRDGPNTTKPAVAR